MTSLTDLKNLGAVLPNAEPMKPGQYIIPAGCPIILVPSRQRGIDFSAYDFMVYDSVTSTDGRLLVQGPGRQYAISIRDGQCELLDRQETQDAFSIGTVGRDPDLFYKATRQFVADLEALCKQFKSQNIIQ